MRCSALWVSERSTAAPFALKIREDAFGRGEELPGRIWAFGESVWDGQLDRLDDSPRAAAAVAAGLRTAVGHPLRLGGQVVGVAEFFSRHESAENPELLELGSALAGRLSDALGRHRAQEALRDANHALEIRVRERTTDLQRAVADLDVEQCGLIERASPLHDVGKVAIPDSVLLKPGPLTAAERLNIETHAEIGHRLLDGSDSAVLQLAATIALTHHEHYDGGGYPRGLAGESIPIEGRIVAIADVFDALTSDRVYRPAMTIDQALAILRDGRGTHFDPVLLDHFLNDLHDAGAEPHTTALDCITASPTSAGPRASAC